MTLRHMASGGPDAGGARALGRGLRGGGRGRRRQGRVISGCRFRVTGTETVRKSGISG
jgi:hypothetical protein